jgi:hypothetical protein
MSYMEDRTMDPRYWNKGPSLTGPNRSRDNFERDREIWNNAVDLRMDTRDVKNDRDSRDRVPFPREHEYYGDPYSEPNSRMSYRQGIMYDNYDTSMPYYDDRDSDLVRYPPMGSSSNITRRPSISSQSTIFEDDGPISRRNSISNKGGKSQTSSDNFEDDSIEKISTSTMKKNTIPRQDNRNLSDSSLKYIRSKSENNATHMPHNAISHQNVPIPLNKIPPHVAAKHTGPLNTPSKLSLVSFLVYGQIRKATLSYFKMDP